MHPKPDTFVQNYWWYDGLLLIIVALFVDTTIVEQVHTKQIASFSFPSTFLCPLNKDINHFYINPALETTARLPLLFCFVSWHFIKHCFSPFNIIMPACAVNYPTSTILMIDHIERAWLTASTLSSKRGVRFSSTTTSTTGNELIVVV